MYRILFFLVGILPFSAGAQDEKWLQTIGAEVDDNIGTIIEKGRAYYALHPELKSVPTFQGFQFDADYKKFRRMEYFWSKRVDENGNPIPLSKQEIAENIKIAKSSSEQRAAWECINQTEPGESVGYDGMGRATSVAFHPTNTNIFMVSGAIGGVWLTTDGGSTYSSIGDNLPNLAVSDIVFDPNNSQTIYAATGDAIWYGLPSSGVYKSTDLGQTWSLTDLTFNLSVNARIPKLLINPENGNTIFAATSDGLYRTLNAGTSWEIVKTGFHWDVAYKPGDTTTVYGLAREGADLEIFSSIDGGSSFTQMTNLGLGFSQYSPSFLGLTNANPNFIYYMNGVDGELHLSTNSGASFSLQQSSLPAQDAFTVSQADENNVYVGALNNYRSDDRGATFSQKSFWYDNGVDTPVHADSRRMVTNPSQPDIIYVCNDGGVYVYDEVNDDWNELSAGLVIMQYYSVAVSQTDPFLVMGGTQDNGTRIRTASPSWRSGNGGDGMECAIDNIDESVLYCTYVNGQLYRSNDGWVNDIYNDITPQFNGNPVDGDWVTPFVLDPSDNNTILAGYDDVYYSTDQGDSWQKISTNLFSGSNIQEVGVSPADSRYLYAIVGSRVKYTSDGGALWTQRNAPVPSSAGIESITFHPSDTNQWWISCGGYSSTSKVFYTSNNGQSFVNISTGLPNVPVNKIVYQNGGNGLLYAGTDLGMYYYNGVQWNAMNDQLPLTQVSDIELQYSSSKIRISTHGRGIWQTDFMDALPPVAGLNPTLEDQMKVYPNPSKGVFHVQQFDSRPMDWSVHDVYGRMIWSANSIINPVIDLQGFPKGVYILHHSNGSDQGAQRIVID